MQKVVREIFVGNFAKKGTLGRGRSEGNVCFIADDLLIEAVRSQVASGTLKP